MIITVSLNTSLDHAYFMESFNVGEVNRVKRMIKTPGGKGLNVARVVSLCDEKVKCTGFVGGYTGAQICRRLDDANIQHSFIETESESRICLNVLDVKHQSTEILESGEDVSEEKVDEFLTLYRTLINDSKVVTLSGSIPKNISPSIYNQLITEANKQNKKTILDTSGILLVEGIKAKPTVVKPNQDEIEMYMNKKITTFTEFVKAGKQIQQEGIELVVISLGKDGALFITEKECYHAKPPTITPINTVGSGDSMVAAIAVSIVKNFPIEKLMKNAIAISSANALSEMTGHFDKEIKDRLYKQVKIKKIK